MNSKLQNALDLGLPVFPCRQDKTPACPGGFKAATADPESIRKFIWDNRLIAVPTGTVAGIDILDIDSRNGGGEWYAENKARLPATRIHRTRSGGLHLLFAANPGVRCSAGKIAPGVDTRAAGGYIIWWPAEGLPFQDYPPGGLPEWPEWLPAAMLPAPPTGGPIAWPAGGSNIRDLHAFEGLIRFVHGAPNGERNARLYWASCRARDLIAKGAVSAGLATDILAEVARRTGLAGREISATIKSGLQGDHLRHG